MKNSRWEMGSSFHETSTETKLTVANTIKWDSYALYLSGRYALLDLIIYKKKYEDLTEVYIPSYYCHDVTRLIESQIKVQFYECSPISIVDLSWFPKGATVILVEYMGNKVKTISDNLLKIIIDKTHDPFSEFEYPFIPEFYFGSLRKIFPIGEGGFLFPKLDYSLKKSTFIHKDKLESLKNAMYLKKMYLSGKNIDKNNFLKDFNDFEFFLNITEGIYEISEQTSRYLSELNIVEIYNKKNKNLEHLYTYYKYSKVLKIFKNTCYFSFFIPMDNYYNIKSKLIKNNIYPIVLWPNYEGEIHLINGEVLVSLHADFRYNIEDIKKLTIILDGIFCEI